MFCFKCRKDLGDPEDGDREEPMILGPTGEVCCLQCFEADSGAVLERWKGPARFTCAADLCQFYEVKTLAEMSDLIYGKTPLLISVRPMLHAENLRPVAVDIDDWPGKVDDYLKDRIVLCGVQLRVEAYRRFYRKNLLFPITKRQWLDTLAELEAEYGKRTAPHVRT